MTLLDRDALTDTIRFWERGRIAYNLVLAVVAFLTAGPSYLMAMPAANWVGFLTLAVIANILYSAAYPVDLLVQASGFRSVWRRHRWMLLAFGIAFGAALAWLMMLSMTVPLILAPQ